MAFAEPFDRDSGSRTDPRTNAGRRVAAVMVRFESLGLEIRGEVWRPASGPVRALLVLMYDSTLDDARAFPI